MKSDIAKIENGIEIDVTDIHGHESELLRAFQACQEGRCSCPTQEYEKVDSITIEKLPDSIRLTIKAKKGSVIDRSEIENCLEYTATEIGTEW